MENGKKRLDSWKDIAQYLGRDISTVRRWEKEKDLPVHRIPGGHRHAVFAYAEEIDAWLEGIPAGGGEMVARPNRLTLRLALIVLAGVAILLIVGVAAYRNGNGGPPARASFAGQTLQVWDTRDRLLWEHQFPFPLVENVLDYTLEHAVKLTDLNGDRVPEVLVLPPYRAGDTPDHQQLYCFASDGKLLWRYSPADVVLTFGGKTYAGPWFSSDMTVLPSPKPHVWVSFHHSSWWPGFLVRVDAQGTGQVRFVHPGWMTHLQAVQDGTATFVLAGGVNNEYDAGMLAVLRDDAPLSSAPQSGNPSYACGGCPQARPHRFFLFPRSEISRLIGARYNLVRDVYRAGAQIAVRTTELDNAEPYHTLAEGVYEFSTDLRLQSSSFTNQYWELHRKLEMEGKVNHSVDDCPERAGLPIREWVSENGWRELSAASDRGLTSQAGNGSPR